MTNSKRIAGWAAGALLLLVAVTASAQSTAQLTGTTLTHDVYVRGSGQAAITISGTFTGTITFKVKHQGQAPVVVDCFSPGSPSTAVNVTTGPGSWSCPVGSYTWLELQFSSYTSGTAFVVADTSTSGGTTVGGAGGGGAFDGVLVDAAGGDPITDAVNDALRVNIVAGSSAGTEYTEGDVDATISGSALLVEGAGNTLVAVQGTVADGLLVNLGGNNDVTVTGTVTANAGTGPWPVTDNGGTLTVDGTVTANLSATDNAVLDAIAASVAGTLTVGSHAVTNAGTFATQAAQSGTWNVGTVTTLTGTTTLTPGTGAANLGKAEDAAHSSGDTLVAVAAVRNDAGTALAGTTGDYIPFTTDSTGALRVTGGGGGTQYAEDIAHNSGDTGTLTLAVRNDSGTALAGTTGDYIPLTTDSSGALRVVGSSGTTQYAEDLAHNSGDSTVFVSAIRRDTTPSSSAGTAGDYTALNADANGRLYTQSVLYNSSGTELTLANDVVEDAAAAGAESGPMVLSVRRDTASSSAGTDGDFATLNTDASGRLWVNCGTGCSGGTQYTEDAVAAGGETMTVTGVIRQDTISSLTSADGDYAALKSNSVGRLYTSSTIDAALPAGSNVIGALTANQSTNVAQMNGVAVTMGNGASGTGVQRVSLASDSTGNIATIGTSVTPGTAAANLGKAEDAVHASGDTGVQVLARRIDTPATSGSASGDYVTFNQDANGAQYVTPIATPASGAGATAFNVASAASTNSTNVKASAGNLYSITLVNTTATLYYLRLYNLASAPTCSSATGYVTTVPVPASTTGAGLTVNLNVGAAFTTGIGYCITGGPTSTDNTNAAVGIYGFLAYK